MNDVQAEITAVEDALKNGIAHALTVNAALVVSTGGSVNVGGPSSLATLQVNGGSTFVGPATFSTTVTFAAGQSFGTLEIAGGSTFVGGVTFSSIATAAAQPRCLIRSTNTTATTNESTAISFTVADQNVGGMWSSGTPDAVTINVAGLYWVQGRAWFTQPAGNAERVLRVKSTSATICRASIGTAAGVVNGTLQSGTIAQLSSGQTLTVTLDGGGAATTYGSASSTEVMTQLVVMKVW
jgi:hypothetical protein